MLPIENFDQDALETTKYDVLDKIADLNKGFETKIEAIGDVFWTADPALAATAALWAGVENSQFVNLDISELTDLAKKMYNGEPLSDGTISRGLKEIQNMKINPEYYEQNLNQHAGWSAEVISTAKENLQAKLEETGIKTVRADDLPELFDRNDEFVDKVRMDSSGNIIDRIQVKFVGKDGEECLSKLLSKKYDKYFDNPDKVTKVEIPQDFYDEIKDNSLIENAVEKAERCLARAQENGNQELTEQYQKKLERLSKIDKMLERSTVTKDEARYATKHPTRYVAKNFASKALRSDEAKAGLSAAALTMGISTVENVEKVIDGEISATEAFEDVAKDTGTAGAVGFGTEFVSKTVAKGMEKSSHQLIKSVGKSGIPAAVISFGIDSFDSVVDFAQGEIDGKELAYDLGESGAEVAGGAAGAWAATAAGAKVGAVIGSAVPGAGTAAGAAVGAAAGFGVSVVGSMVGTAVASEAYATAVEKGSEGVEVLANKAQEMADKTVEAAKAEIPDKVDDVKSAINNFAASCKIPISV